MSLERTTFGHTDDGESVELYTLQNRHGLTAKVMTYGAILTSVQAPDRHGQLDEITLGLETLADYRTGHPHLGAVAGRVANRIAAGRFSLDGIDYQLAVNRPPNHLHGGNKGFDKVVWQVLEHAASHPGPAVTLSYLSPDGDEGYPGNLTVSITYSLNDDNELGIAYEARTDRRTPVNLTNHTYWNLAGAGSGDILEHELQLTAAQYLPTDEASIPTGEIRAVRGTPMDFNTATTIGARIDEVAPGYDCCFVLPKAGGSTPTRAATVLHPDSGRCMHVYTTAPGVQLYTGNFLAEVKGRAGHIFEKHHGLCLECQHFPDSVNRPNFPSTILAPGQTYRQVTVHRFEA
jgi:aldose 1-epimerase